MAKDLDTRNFAYDRAADSGMGDLSGFAAVVSYNLPGAHRVRVSRMNPWTASPDQLVSTGAPAGVDPRTADDDPNTFASVLIDQALEHIRAAAQALGFAAAEPPDLVPDLHVEELTNKAGYAVHLYQQYRGIPVFQMERTVRFNRDGAVVDVVGTTISLPYDFKIVPAIDARVAAKAAAEYIAASEADATPEMDQFGQPIPARQLDVSGFTPTSIAGFPLPAQPVVLDKGPFGEPIPAHLVLFYRGPDTRLGWHMIFTMPSLQAQYAVIVAADGEPRGLNEAPGTEILYCQETSFSIRARGPVYVHNPGIKERELVNFPRLLEEYPFDPLPPGLPIDFPQHWCKDEGNATLGNNTIAVLGEGIDSLIGEIINDILTFDPASGDSNEQKMLNIFYFCNYMHDFFYMLGFDEASNFQEINFTGRGLPGDPVLARAHAGMVDGTANMLTLADGQRALMNMGLVEGINRHTALDSDVVFHEFVHGVTNRLVGGRRDARGLQQPQSRGMGEGWSDYFALTIQNYHADQEKVVTGDWVTGREGGIRMHPYNEHYPGTFGQIGRPPYTGVHNIGEIWCATLMQMNRNFAAVLGSKKLGHLLGWQIVVDGLKLTPANPSFLDARDAILRALDAQHDAGQLSDEDYKKVRKAAWEAFAKFGMGPNASSVGASLFGIIEDMSLPADL